MPGGVLFVTGKRKIWGKGGEGAVEQGIFD